MVCTRPLPCAMQDTYRLHSAAESTRHVPGTGDDGLCSGHKTPRPHTPDSLVAERDRQTDVKHRNTEIIMYCML